jgi:hypothetical protein
LFGLYNELATEAMRRAYERLQAAPGWDPTLEALDFTLLQPVLLGAYQRVSLQILPGSSPAEWLGPGRAQYLERLASAMVAELRQPSGLDRSTVDYATFRLDRFSVDQLMGQVWRCRTAHIQAAIERGDFEDAAVRALVCAATPIPLPAQLTADVLVGVEQPSVFVALSRLVAPGDTAPLFDLLRRARLAATSSGTEQAALTLFALWKLDRPAPQVLLPSLRTLSRSPLLSARAAGWALWLARELGDSGVEDAFKSRGGAIAEMLINIMGSLLPDYWALPIDDVIASLPARISDVGVDGIPARAAPRIGRNEPCLCGSGKKYKRCCADKPAVIPPSTERARLERLQEAAPRLDVDQISRLSRVDLALLEIARLRDPALVQLMRRHVLLRDWKRAVLALDELVRRHGPAFTEEHINDVVQEALIARQHDIAENVLARLQPSTARASFRLELDLAARAPGALPALEAAARAALTEEQDPLGLTFILLRTMPALGVLVARGMLIDSAALEYETLVEGIEDTRGALLLPPEDPAAARLDALDGGREHPSTDPPIKQATAAPTVHESQAKELQAKLDDASERLTALQRQLDGRERDLARAQQEAREYSLRAQQAAPESRSPQVASDVRALREKIETLQAHIRERNQESALLRRQLSEAVARDLDATGPTPLEARRRPDRGDDDNAEPLPFVSSRTLLFPQFIDAAQASLGSVPRNVASQAMRTVASLAAGDPSAWRGIKQAKDMRRQVLMARVGIHHRLLFRVEGTALEVLDVVTRESLLTHLKRMRSA